MGDTFVLARTRTQMEVWGIPKLGPPVVALYPFWGRVPLLK